LLLEKYVPVQGAVTFYANACVASNESPMKRSLFFIGVKEVCVEKE
jgi:hypothetical protein